MNTSYASLLAPLSKKFLTLSAVAEDRKVTFVHLVGDSAEDSVEGTEKSSLLDSIDYILLLSSIRVSLSLSSNVAQSSTNSLDGGVLVVSVS